MARKRGKVPGTRSPRSVEPPPDFDPEKTAFHEACHVVVAHSVGKRPLYARITPELLTTNHPENSSGAPMWSLGYHLAEPQLAEEVTRQQQVGLPQTPEQRRWLLQEIPINIVGAIAEAGMGADGDASDRRAAANAAFALGRIVDVPGGRKAMDPALQRAGMEIVRTILRERVGTIRRVATALQERGELDEEQLAELLVEAPQGSHEHLLATLEGS
jgi:hypothetical protein